MTIPNDTEPRSNCGVPAVALRWLILHATTSNVDLARISNVNRSWRDVATTVILEQATNKAAASVPLLLLPSMAAQLIRKNGAAKEDVNMKEKQPGGVTLNNNKNHEETAPPSREDKINNNSQEITLPEETFCAAWFAPEGVQLLDLDEEQELSDEDDSSEDYSNAQSKSKQGMHRHCRHSTGSNAPKKKKNAHPTRSKSPMMLNIQRRAPRLEQIPQHHVWARGHGVQAKASFEDQGILVSHEWRGYRHAMEVLFPFGYAEFFVQHVLHRSQVQDQMRRRENNQQTMDISGSVHDINQRTSSSLEAEDEPVEDITQASIAVRGATIARPEGYCLCWEHPNKSSSHQQVEWVRSNQPGKKDKNNEEMVQTIKWQERQRKLKQWKEWRRQLQLTVLPQVLVRKPPNSSAVVQFLNSDEKHAVRFLTPKFECGPIGEPVTIIVVGIATEDGCFCSGLHHRFELGHLYPNNAMAELAEMSPICIATDPWECTPGPAAERRTSAGPRRTPLEQHLDSDDDSEDESEAYSNDSSSDLAGDDSQRVPPHKKRGWLNNCACIFQDNSDPCGFATENSNSANGKTENSDTNISTTLRAEDSEDEEGTGGEDGDHDADRILRGSRIPGIWHCYTAVFDGKNSLLRVDGVQEVLASERNPAKKADPAGDDAVASKKPGGRRQGPRPMLDGLTIGSDHCFDMTLCFGQGSGGEGEGAIAEIAVFGGCLQPADLEVIEKQLMIKHGIPTPELTREALVQEDEWIRKSHAAYCQIPPEAAAAHLRHSDGTPVSFNQNTIPLRVMTKHRSVAWHQVNSVTGEELRIKRIGSRSAGSSSDW